ncbi:MAG: MbcA/ParS/Xre antitoxin family protein [Paraglaciecola sp.]|uniref:MbcA/ParS/Xre antitoxin family protein n=1 Tax=Pseudomonadati TaxID=3379134 RepID=UPI00273EC743|nr:MbcA/ParS/Xre antitoxin family protein [Paraglaciecola sp.]MDP5030426.1 MbcA/ParS/Xre antitoxin family protein [Paraglaciecola sp.]MDP5131409.1 MbcA/ParS/Xre antitoxin family protein [Paraglaciecola sp.]
MSALANIKESKDRSSVLLKAFNNACAELGVNKATAGKIIGVNRSTLSRKEGIGLGAESKSSELSLHFIRLYRSLFAISGGDQGFMRHWFITPNSALGGKPAELVQTVQGLMQTNDYLDAMRGKI